MGFCGSIGADYIDYIITDEVSSPPEWIDRIYSEKAIYMPHSYFVNDYAQSSLYVFNSQRSNRRMYGLPEDKFIFANFNQLYKLDPATYTVWMNILKRVPNSVLWLLEYPIDAKENLEKEAEARGVDKGRIIVTPKVKKHEHIERCHLADLSLDNPITNGHTTTCDLLWSGLP
jgi:protein O-GlcNAc transferase